MSKLYLGFDAGTQSVKVSVYDENLKSTSTGRIPSALPWPPATAPAMICAFRTRR